MSDIEKIILDAYGADALIDSQYDGVGLEK